MKIDLYAQDGSPLGVTPEYIYGRGVGGAELAMMTWAEVMARRGHQVRVYNNPTQFGDYAGVEYLPQNAFERNNDRDVFVIYRSPNPHIQAARARVKIHWSTDQYTIGNYGVDIFPYVDYVVCISPFHVEYHKSHYPVEPHKIGYLDLGVRMWDYDQDIEKIPGRCIFCSVPERGLNILRVIWPEIKKREPEASLVITSDYRLWGAPAPLNHTYRMDWVGMKDVAFLGKVERTRLTRLQLESVCQPYPCVYDELHCISASECQVAGAIPVTTPTGALRTTNFTGAILAGNPADYAWQQTFADKVVETMNLSDRERRKRQEAACNRFDWDIICSRWERLIETGEFVNGSHHYAGR